jgi:hypothetical protein
VRRGRWQGDRDDEAAALAGYRAHDGQAQPGARPGGQPVRGEAVERFEQGGQLVRWYHRAGVGDHQLYPAVGPGGARDPAVMPAWAMLGGVTATLVIGAVAGLYPAVRAARLPPTEALAAT